MNVLSVRLRRFLAGVLPAAALLTVAAPGAMAEDPNCAAAIKLDPNATLRTVGEKRGNDGRTTTFFDVEVPSAGLLAMEVITSLDSSREPRVALFDEACRRAGEQGTNHVLIRRWGSGQIVGVRTAGTLRFRGCRTGSRAGLG